VTTDGHESYPRAIREELEQDGHPVLHRTNQYLNNLIEQDHRGIKSRYGPMKGFGAFESAYRFCRAHDELRNFYRPATTRNEKISLSERRRIHRERTAEVMCMLMTA
jgi:putative transposase